MKKSIVTILHSGYWLIYLFLFTFLFFVSAATTNEAFENWDDWLLIVLVALVTGVINFYTFYFWLAPSYLFLKRNKGFIARGLAFCILSAICATILISLFFTILLSVSLHAAPVFLFLSTGDIIILIASFTFLGLLNGGVATIIRGFIGWYDERYLKEMLISKNRETEMALLKAQINPHFLFNTLNNIDVLIEKDAQRASAYLNRLSDIMRFVLYESKSDNVLLVKELEYIEKYIQLQKIRTSNEEYVSFSVVGEPSGITIAPMIFIPYIENAFKYAVNKKVKEAIIIRVTITENNIDFECINVIENTIGIKPESGRLGNSLLKNRLDILYNDRYNLDIQNDGKTYRVNLSLASQVHELHYN